jgi:thioredoxin 2
MTEATTGRSVTVPCPICFQLNRVDLGRLAHGPRCAGCSRPLHLDRPVPVTEDHFDQVIRGATVPVLVDFYADWCGPCRVMAPVLDEFAAAHQGEVLVAKVDTDRSPNLAHRLGIRGIPTLIAFRHGSESGRHVGLGDAGILARLAGLAA